MRCARNRLDDIAASLRQSSKVAWSFLQAPEIYGKAKKVEYPRNCQRGKKNDITEGT